MDTDVLVVGAGPTGLMLANQLGRRGVRTLIIDRHAGPSLQTRALGVQARTLEIYSHLGIVERALELGKRATGANMWAQGRRAARVPFGDIGRDLSPYPFLLILGQDDNERLLGDALAQLGHGRAVEHGACRPRAGHRSGDGNAQATGRHDARGHGRVGRRMRRRAQRGARAERDRVSGRALRACVLRRRYADDGADGAGRAQRLSVARGIPPVLPDARDRSLARCRHRAAGAAREETISPSTT